MSVGHWLFICSVYLFAKIRIYYESHAKETEKIPIFRNMCINNKRRASRRAYANIFYTLFVDTENFHYLCGKSVLASVVADTTNLYD